MLTRLLLLGVLLVLPACRSPASQCVPRDDANWVVEDWDYETEFYVQRESVIAPAPEAVVQPAGTAPAPYRVVPPPAQPATGPRHGTRTAPPPPPPPPAWPAER